MTDILLLLVARYQTELYYALGAGMVIYVLILLRASQQLEQASFGLERSKNLQRRNTALAMLVMLFALSISIYLVSRAVVPNLILSRPTPVLARPTIVPTPTLIAADVTGPLFIDSGGCANPNATLTQPKPNDRLVSSVEVKGSANVENFAFYKFEISGANTNGAWVTLGASDQPVVDGTLGSFDASVHQAGEYAFRLVVTDNTGAYPYPCTISVTLIGKPTARP